jgi:pimeloyl-ACP methyl ester carboxylesterase
MTATGTRIDLDAPSGPLSVLLAGNPEARAVLAVHGFGSSAELTWQVTGHVRALVSAGRRVVAPDLPGHGGSHKPRDPAAYSLDGLVADLAAVANEVGAERVDLLGYSLGARLSVALAGALGQRLDPTVRRLVIGGYDNRRLFRGVDAGQLARILRQPAAIAEADPQTARIAGIALAVPGNDLAALAAMVTGLPPTEHATAPPGIPTLVVAGTADPLAADAERWAAQLPHAEFVPVPGRDHVSTLTAAVFRRRAADFLAAASDG